MVQNLFHSSGKSFLYISAGIFMLVASFFLFDSIKTAKAQCVPVTYTGSIVGGGVSDTEGDLSCTPWGVASCTSSTGVIQCPAAVSIQQETGVSYNGDPYYICVHV